MKKPFQKEYLSRIFNTLMNLTQETKQGTKKVIEFVPPEKIRSHFDFNLHSKLNEDELIETANKAIKYSVHSGHPHYYNTLFGGTNEYALSGEYISNALNNAMYTYEAAPIFSVMEDSFYKYIGKELLNWESVDGIFAPGGSISNLYALLVARHYFNPDFKKKGLYSHKPLAIFTSELSHYSIKKSAIVLGYGTDHIYEVEADEKGKMIPEDLERKIVEAKNMGAEPMFCNTTLGTTVFGAIDPVKEIGEICKRHNIWHHVDGCFGGCILMVDDLRKQIGSFNNVDSYAWDFHKVFNVPKCCSVFVTKHVGLLDSCNSTNAEYLFMKDKVVYDARLDSGDKSIQCGRHNDIMKLWMYWKGLGTEGIKEQVKNAMDNAKYLSNLVKNHENFELILDPEWVSVSFYYIPDRLRKMDKNDENYKKELDLIAPKMKAEMVRRGTMMMSYQKQTQKRIKHVNFLRPVVHLGKTKEDCDFIIQELNDIGKHL
jgi:glutamate/tyrosine decarboxylase-like PLP-dependent enzyme